MNYSKTSQHDLPHHRETAHRLARISLFGFILTFVVARALVFLIMAHAIPNMYFFLRGTHVHHLNYGIFALAAVGGYGVLRRPTGRAAEITALFYGFAMALTFDEFGMWLNLGGSYWQRVSVDAVVVVAAILALVAFSTTIKKFESRHFWSFIVLAVMLTSFGIILFVAGHKLGDVVGDTLRQLEMASSP